jgi:hypothetical protein
MPFDPGLSGIQAFEPLSNAAQLLLKATHLPGFQFSHFQRHLAEAEFPQSSNPPLLYFAKAEDLSPVKSTCFDFCTLQTTRPIDIFFCTSRTALRTPKNPFFNKE